MAQTFSKIQAQIAKLQADAEKARRSEVSDVVAKIKVAIAAYDLTAKDLFGANAAARGNARKVTRAAKSKSRGDLTAKFADAEGNTWVGRGPRPLWLRNALKSGKSLSDFEMNAGTPGAAEASPTKRSKKSVASGNASGAAKYSDGTGNTWGGRGPRPRWLTAALATGKTLEQLLA